MSDEVTFTRDARRVSFPVKGDALTVARQINLTSQRPLHVLSPAWFEPGCAEAMADWIKRTNDET